MPTEKFDQGVVTSRDRGRLAPGEMTEATGVVYRQGDDRAHKMGGRQSFGVVTPGRQINGLSLCSFDAGGTDVLLALVANTAQELYVKSPTAPALDPWQIKANTTLGDQLSVAHYNDKWYIATGGTKNYSLDGSTTLKPLGMQAPLGQGEAVPKTGTNPDQYPTIASGFSSSENVLDTDTETAAYSVLDDLGAEQTLTIIWADTDFSAERFVKIQWGLDSDPSVPESPDLTFVPGGPPPYVGYNVTVSIEFEDSDGTVYPMKQVTLTAPQDTQTETLSIPNGVDLAASRARVRFQYNSGNLNARLFVYDARVTTGGNATPFSVTQSFLYAFVEVDNTTVPPTRSPRSQTIPVDHDGATFNYVELTPPSVANPLRTTGWELYRTPPGGNETQLGLIDSFSVTQPRERVLDTFDRPLTLQAAPLYRLVFVGDTPYDQDAPPPALRRIGYFDGSLVGLVVGDPRALAWALPGLPESWPAIYRFRDFSLEEHDELVDFMEVAGSLVIWARGAVFRMDRLPQTINGQAIDATVTRVRGAPGAVGKYAVASVEVEGQQTAAWISDYGLYISTGHVYRRFSEDIDWTAFDGFDKSTWVLHYDKRQRVLRLAYSSTGGTVNDRFWTVHLGPEHRKQNGQPKWTGPHYGSITALAAGQVGNGYRVFSGHSDDGTVYREDTPGYGLDDSESLPVEVSELFVGPNAGGTLTSFGWVVTTSTNPSAHRLRITSRRRYNGRDEYEIHGGFLYHTDFGAGQSLDMTHTVGRDVSGSSSIKTQALSLAGAGDTQYDVGAAGRWSEIRLTHDGEGLGALVDYDEELMPGARAGAQGVR